MTETKLQTAVDNAVTKLNAKVDELQSTLQELKDSSAVQSAGNVVERFEKAINEIRTTVQELRSAK
jgi:uncharacterized phage infection (PIP) family protein YhgE